MGVLTAVSELSAWESRLAVESRGLWGSLAVFPTQDRASFHVRAGCTEPSPAGCSLSPEMRIFYFPVPMFGHH